jgi:hypothetical protein
MLFKIVCCGEYLDLGERGVTGGRRKLSNEQFYTLCTFDTMTEWRMMELTEHVVNVREIKNFADRRNIKYTLMILYVVERWRGVRGTDWIDLAQDSDRWRACLNAVMNLWVP